MALFLAVTVFICAVSKADAQQKYPYRFLSSQEGCVEPANRKSVPVFCPAGWVKRTARVGDNYWKKYGSWYASMKAEDGIRHCTPRYRQQTGSFCAPAHFKGRFWHLSKIDDPAVTEFNFADPK